MQAIQSKYIAPTNTKGTRVKAWCAAGSLTVPWDYNLSDNENHATAVNQLKGKLGWNSPYYGMAHGGTLPNGDMCWVFVK